MTRAAVIRRIGTTVLRGKYRLDGVLGEGGMATVYAATHLEFGKPFAVNMLHSELLSDEQIRSRFLREGKVASLLHHGAVEIFDCETDTDGSLLLIMELLDGASVDDLGPSRGRPVPLKDALCIACLLLEVLEAAHAKGIVHRDIKPANLFLRRDGQLKVLDFGISRLRDSALTPSTKTIGGPMGTPAFMAPEQARADADAIDARTDLFGVGATLFTLISGEHLHSGVDARQVMFRAATEPARSLASVAPEIPTEIVEVVAKAVAFEKSERWESAADMREAILAFYECHFGAQQLSGLAALVAAHPGLLQNSPTERTSQPPDLGGDRARITERSAVGAVPGLAGASTIPEPQRDVERQAPRVASPLRVALSGQRFVLLLGVALILAFTQLLLRSHGRDARRASPPNAPIRHVEASVPPVVPAAVAPVVELAPRLSEAHGTLADPRRSATVRPPRVHAPAVSPNQGGLDPPPLPARH